MSKGTKILIFVFLIAVIVGIICSAITQVRAASPAPTTYIAVEKEELRVKDSLPIIVEYERVQISQIPADGKDLYRFYAEQINEQYYPNVPVDLVMAIMKVESNYRPNAGSNAGAVGLMQVIPRYHQHRVAKYCLTDLWDPYTNIICAMDLLNERYEVHGNWRSALFDYNHSWAYVNHVLRTMTDI